MNATVGAAASSRSVTTTRRYRSRVGYAVWPFVWRGLLPLLGLVALAWYALVPFARNSIESVARQEIRSVLDGAGFQWVDVGISGQHVQLRGVEPAAGLGDQALQLARNATCQTWWGRRHCAVQVIGSFGGPVEAQPAAAAVDPSAEPVAAPAPGAVARCESELAGLLAAAQVRFATSRAEIRADSTPLLDRLAEAASRCEGRLQVEGHTDSVGDAAFNQDLSERRAAAVRDALVARGVPADRLVARGFGATRPIAENSQASGRALNRRIEFKLITGP